MRKSFDTLAAIVRELLQKQPLSGDLYVFCNRPRNRIKVLLWDGSGLWVMAKRLEKGTFSWPKAGGPGSNSVTMTTAELSLLLSGIDLASTSRRRWYRRPDDPVS